MYRNLLIDLPYFLVRCLCFKCQITVSNLCLFFSYLKLCIADAIHNLTFNFKWKVLLFVNKTDIICIYHNKFQTWTLINSHIFIIMIMLWKSSQHDWHIIGWDVVFLFVLLLGLLKAYLIASNDSAMTSRVKRDSETGRVRRDASDLPPNPDDINVKVGVRAAHLKYIFPKQGLIPKHAGCDTLHD